MLGLLFFRNMHKTFFVRFLENSPVTHIPKLILRSQRKFLFPTSICVERFMNYSCDRSLFQKDDYMPNFSVSIFSGSWML